MNDETTKEPHMSGLQFDNKISLGLIIFGGITAYANLRGTQK